MIKILESSGDKRLGRVEVDYNDSVFNVRVHYIDDEGTPLYNGCKINSNDALDYRFEVIEDQIKNINGDLRRSWTHVEDTCDFKLVDGKIVNCEPYTCKKLTNLDPLSAEEVKFIMDHFIEFLRQAKRLPEPEYSEYDD